MTIKDAARLTGITQANIRFYEAEGLVDPARSANGYRDYSEADIELLLRIKLLRMLKMPIEDIKAVCAGAQSLETALAIHLEELDRASTQLERSRSICEELKNTAATFETLDARRYLSVLERADVAVIQHDVLPRVKAPYRRYFARGLDWTICSAVLLAIEVFVLKLNLMNQTGDYYSLIHSTLAYVLLLAVEPFLLSRFGTTPGKWILGLSVTDMEDNNLSYKVAQRRTLNVIWFGEGWGIPIYSTICSWRCLGKCEAGEELPWEQDSVLHLKKPRLWRALLMVAAQAAMFAVMIVLLVTPVNDTIPNKGDLTLAQFCENYNHLAEEYNLGHYMVRLSSDGRWIELDEQFDSYAVIDDSFHYELPELEFKEEDGVLKSVSFTWTADMTAQQAMEEGSPYIPDWHEEMRLIGWAFACARTERGSMSEEWDSLKTLTSDENRYTSFSLPVEDATILSIVDYEGYRHDLGLSVLSVNGEYKLITELDAQRYYCKLAYSVSCP